MTLLRLFACVCAIRKSRKFFLAILILLIYLYHLAGDNRTDCGIPIISSTAFQPQLVTGFAFHQYSLIIYNETECSKWVKESAWAENKTQI